MSAPGSVGQVRETSSRFLKDLAAKSSKEPIQKLPTSKQNDTGRNKPCPCGSGHKYRKCCGKKK
jgi:preprotein translocase subunit SecA